MSGINIKAIGRSFGGGGCQNECLRWKLANPACLWDFVGFSIPRVPTTSVPFPACGTNSKGTEGGLLKLETFLHIVEGGINIQEYAIPTATTTIAIACHEKTKWRYRGNEKSYWWSASGKMTVSSKKFKMYIHHLRWIVDVKNSAVKTARACGQCP